MLRTEGDRSKNIEVRSEAVDVTANGVPSFRHTEHPEDRYAANLSSGHSRQRIAFQVQRKYNHQSEAVMRQRKSRHCSNTHEVVDYGVLPRAHNVTIIDKSMQRRKDHTRNQQTNTRRMYPVRDEKREAEV
jgi:hypothetical protein